MDEIKDTVLIYGNAKGIVELVVFSEIRCGTNSFFFYMYPHQLINVLALCNFNCWIVGFCCLFAEQHPACSVPQCVSRVGSKIWRQRKLQNCYSKRVRKCCILAQLHRESGNVVALYDVNLCKSFSILCEISCYNSMDRGGQLSSGFTMNNATH
jgi:hypothetical protein